MTLPGQTLVVTRFRYRDLAADHSSTRQTTTALADAEHGEAAEITPHGPYDVRIGGVDLIAGIADEWRELCAASGRDCPALRPEWFQNYFSSFEREAEPVVVAAFQHARLAAVLPLLRTREWFCGLPVTLLRSATNCHSPRYELITRNGGPDPELARTLMEAVAGLTWDAFQLSCVPDDGPTGALHACAAAKELLTGRRFAHRVPYLSLPGPEEIDDWWPEAASSQFVNKMRKLTRRILSEPGSQLERIARPTPEELEQFFRLEASGWKGRSETAIASQPDTHAFYRRLARSAIQRRQFNLYFLKCRDRLIAADFGLTTADRYYSLKCAYDEAFASLSPGHVLTHLVLRDCSRRRLKVFDFCGEASQAKRVWTRESTPVWTLYWFRPTLRGRWLRFLQLSVKPLLRRMLPRGLQTRGAWQRFGLGRR